MNNRRQDICTLVKQLKSICNDFNYHKEIALYVKMLEGKREVIHNDPAQISVIDKTINTLKGVLDQVRGFF